MATVKCADNLFFDRIAKAAGSTKFMAASYDGEFLTVSDVTQESLDSAFLEYDHDEAKAEQSRNLLAANAIARLSKIDAESVRPLRAKISGASTTQDDEKLAALEMEASALRDEIKGMTKDTDQ